MKKKIIIIAISAAIAIAAGLFYPFVLQPRLEVYNAIQGTIPDIGEPAKYFTEYSVKNNNTFTVENEHISAEIPVGFQKDEERDYTYFWRRGEYESVIIMESGEQKNMIFLDPARYDGVNTEIGVDGFKKAFEAFGNGIPDSAFNTYKVMYMLENDDYNFWDLNIAKTYLAVGYSKCVNMVFHQNYYIYERDNICAIIGVTDNETKNPPGKVKYSVQAEVYTTDNLNICTTMLINTNSLEEAYGIINSAKPVK